MPVSFRQLEIFERIAATGSVTRAGEELLLTQSAVSMALSQLEQQSATPLFERTGRSLLLNDSGRLLLKEAREILLAVKRIEQQLQGDTDQELVGELRGGGEYHHWQLPATGTFRSFCQTPSKDPGGTAGG